jgi:hypothetical protein
VRLGVWLCVVGSVELVGGAELAGDVGSVEVAGEGGVGDVVVGCELAQWFSGGAAADEVRVWVQAAEAIPARVGPGGGSRIVRERADEDRRVDRAEHVRASAQVGRLDDRFDLVAGGDNSGGDVVQLRQVGQRDLAVTANTYTHVLTDETELDYAALLGW